MLLHCSSTAEMLSRGVCWLFCSWCVLYDIKKHTLDKLETWFSLEGYNTVQKFRITFLDSDKNIIQTQNVLFTFGIVLAPQNK